MQTSTALQRLEEGLFRARVRTAPLVRPVRPVLAALAVVGFAWRFLLGVGPGVVAALHVANEVLLLLFALDAAYGVLVLSPAPLRALRERRARNALAVSSLAYLALAWTGLGPATFHVEGVRHALVGAILTSLVIEELYRLSVSGIAAYKLRPPVVVIASFLILIAIGTGLLLSPASSVQPPGGDGLHNLDLVDALFMATSASCVTGLGVVDPGTQLTRHGQVVLLVLVQIGGLGIMTLFVFFAAALGRGIQIKDQVMVRELLQLEEVGGLGRMLLAIAIVTLGCEVAGAAVLYALFESEPGATAAAAAATVGDGPLLDGERLFHATFFSVSAFNNAGFSLHADGIYRFRGSYGVLAVIAGLFVIGGLGFPVVYDLFAWTRSRLRRALRPRSRERKAPRRLTVQTRLVLVTSLVLSVLGAALIAAYEWRGQATGSWPVGERIANAVFMSLSCRTAGFNTTDPGTLATGSLLVMMALMFIGGSPGGTAGGVKTTTIAMIHARVLGLLRRREEIEVGNRMLPRRAIALANGVMSIAIGCILTFTLLLLATDPHLTLRDALFEVVSALGTVGFTTGITTKLSASGKLVIALAMFVGRIGPLTLILGLGEERSAAARYAYPTARVMIG